ncbi:MAG: hypothetical protein M1820_008858 [Bogoriella megaspora]|nr:MAG: hypothetical protein M1820_008858 [Bogoriella megaspora]
MSGVRGLRDPNVQVNVGSTRSIFYQDVNVTLSNATDFLLPWYLNYAGNWSDPIQCMTAGSNGWQANHGALNGDLNNKWAEANTPYSLGYYKRSDLPVHFGIAEGWTVADMYQQSVIASTTPNRVSWFSGSINCPGGPQTPDQGGMTIDNSDTPGCELPNTNCYPFSWKTYAEYLQDAGITWQVYQDEDNFGDNAPPWFTQFQNAPNISELYQRGMTFVGLEKFYADARAGTLPAVSYIIGPAELSEHPPYQPKDGAWLQQQVVNAVTTGDAYNSSVLMISYDETGGWGDHVTPFHSPVGTAGEWVQDPYGQFGDVYTGPGFRLPFYIISPWTRGGRVFTEHADHSSQLKFMEQWLAAKGHDVVTTQIPAWRRAHMSDLVNAFDFTSEPDLSLPAVPLAETPSTDASGTWNGYAVCEATYFVTQPPVPYGQQSSSTSLVTEDGFKKVIGYLTEGRYLVFESSGIALERTGNGTVGAGIATSQHENQAQRWILHQLPDWQSSTETFEISSVIDGTYIGNGLDLVKAGSAATITVKDLGNGKGYTMGIGRRYVGVRGKKLVIESTAATWNVYSVTYGD